MLSFMGKSMKIDISCFSYKHTKSKNRSKDSFARNMHHREREERKLCMWTIASVR